MLLVCLEGRIRWKGSHAYMHNYCNSATQRGSVNTWVYVLVHIFSIHSYPCIFSTRGPVHEFMHGWGPLEWPVEIGPQLTPPALQPRSPAAPPTPPWPGTAPSPAPPSHLWDNQSGPGGPCPTPSVSRR